MSDWTEEDSATYAALGDVAVPRRDEMMAMLVAAIPFTREAAFRVVDLGAGEGRLSEAILDAFPFATLLALDGSASMREAAAARTARFGPRARVAAFALETLEWWDLLFGAGLVVSSLALHHLNDAKKQYLYKAVADRLSPGGAFLVADLVNHDHEIASRLAADTWDASARAQAEGAGRPELYARFLDAHWNHFRFPDQADRPSALLHHLVWLKHAGFSSVECVWMFAGHAVFGGFKAPQDASDTDSRRDDTARAPN